MRYKIDANASSTPLHASRKNETEYNDAFEELAAGRAGDKNPICHCSCARTQP
jgi:hypothetical protein